MKELLQLKRMGIMFKFIRETRSRQLDRVVRKETGEAEINKPEEDYCCKFASYSNLTLNLRRQNRSRRGCSLVLGLCN